jgi:hypothetical protein
MVQQLESAVVPPLNEMEKEVTHIRFLCHWGVQQYLPDYARHGEETECHHRVSLMLMPPKD